MNFLSINFIVFIGISFIMAWVLKGNLKKIGLLLLNFCFLLSFSNPIHWIYICFIIGITYFISFELSKRKSKNSLIFGISIVVVGLCFFKYAGLFNFTNIIMPIGISFYTFKSISYMVETYKGNIKLPSLLNYVIYISYFPVITAGPINKPSLFFEQLDNLKNFDYKYTKNGAVLCALGLFQKLVFANYLFTVINAIQASEKMLTGWYTVLYIVLYSFYIYIDFDGYSNIAIGLSRMLGFDIERNFKTPYLATSIKDFWSRWHITLSTWLKEYIYIPLGGSKKGLSRKYLNIILVFLVSGIWHGSTIVFVIWGLGHGLLNIIEDQFKRRFPIKKSNIVIKGIAILFNFIAVSCLWVFFDAASIGDAMQVFANIFKPMFFSLKTIGLTDREGVWLLVIIVTTIVTDCFRNKINMIEWISNRNVFLRWGFYIALIIITIIFGTYGPGYNVGDFIYVTF
ncbi:MBOAT family O-acyltransferase [Anaerorhabdus sp.]|uniref:MBOAT family O-acyltransferase n=1 Tax=Anaerorhabdus sp. TaxID=1872524 RepID=UPI002FC68F14